MLHLNNKLLVICGLAVVGLVGIAILWLLKGKQSESYAQSHGIARTRMDIQNVALAIRIYVRDSSILPEGLSSSTNVSLDAKRLYSSLFEGEAEKHRIGQPSPHWKESQELVDRWGNALNFHLRPSNEADSYTILIWSNGPNGRNEEGRGDDITSDVFEVALHAGHK